MSSPSISVEQVDRKIHELERQLEKFRNVRAAILELAGKAVSNGKKPNPPNPPQPQQQGQRNTPNSTGLRAQVLALMSGLPSQFTGDTVVQNLQAKKFNFEGRDPRAAVRDSLYALAKENKGIRVKEQGNAGKPTLYEKV